MMNARHTNGTRKAAADRIVAVRAELSDLQRRTDPAGRVMARAVARDLAALETLLCDSLPSRKVPR